MVHQVRILSQFSLACVGHLVRCGSFITMAMLSLCFMGHLQAIEVLREEVLGVQSSVILLDEMSMITRLL